MSNLFDRQHYQQAYQNIVRTSNILSLDEATRQLDDLRKKCDDMKSEGDIVFAERQIDKLRLRFAVNTCAPLSVVREQFWQNVRGGFNGPLAAMDSVIEFAWYCSEVRETSEGSSALRYMRRWIVDTYGDLEEDALCYIYDTLDEWDEFIKSRTVERNDESE